MIDPYSHHYFNAKQSPALCFSRRCEAVSTGVAVMGSSAHNLDYYFPTLQS